MPSCQTKQRYPLTVLDLSTDDLKLLLTVLAMVNTFHALAYTEQNPIASHDMVKRAVRSLPTHLRNKILIQVLPPVFPDTAAMCSCHIGLNPYIVNHIFLLIKSEVVGHLGPITRCLHDKKPLALDTDVSKTVRSLQNLERMWWFPNRSQHSPYPTNGVQFQYNKCEACMITRVVMDKFYLQSLRAALLSRIRSNCRYREPRLLRVINKAIDTYGMDPKRVEESQKIITNSDKIAPSLKRARKDAVRLLHSHSHRCGGRCMKEQDGQNRQFECSRHHNPNSLHPTSIDPAELPSTPPHEDQEGTRRNRPPPTNSSRNTLDSIIAAYASSIPESINIAALDFPHIPSLSVSRGAYRIEGGGSEYDPSNDGSPQIPGPASGGTDWENVMKEGSPFEKLIGHIQHLIEEGGGPAKGGSLGACKALRTDDSELQNPEPFSEDEDTAEDQRTLGPGDTT